jgi:RNA polymerase sigma-70 factor (sigma-E family)
VATVALDVESYREYVTARMDGLRRTAYLLCGDWHTADDLVSTTLVKLYRQWRRVSVMDNRDAYARRVLLRVWLDERRRPWRREHSTSVLPDHVEARGARIESVPDRLAVLALLAEVPPRRRAVLVLRYYCDLSVEETAAALGCSPGTVKSQAARALEALRARMVGTKSLTQEA